VLGRAPLGAIRPWACHDHRAKSNGRLKQRRLGIPALRDRLVQEGLRMILDPIYEADFSRHSYGFRQTRSTKDAVTYLASRHPSAKPFELF